MSLPNHCAFLGTRQPQTCTVTGAWWQGGESCEGGEAACCQPFCPSRRAGGAQRGDSSRCLCPAGVSSSALEVPLFCGSPSWLCPSWHSSDGARHMAGGTAGLHPPPLPGARRSHSTQCRYKIRMQTQPFLPDFSEVIQQQGAFFQVSKHQQVDILVS